MKGMWASVCWPERHRKNGSKYLNKYCEFHRDHGHNTEQHYALRKEIVYLLKADRLKEFMSDKGKEILDKAAEKGVGASSSHSKSTQTPARIINMIVGMSELSGNTRLWAKRKVREVINVHGVRKESETGTKVVFSEEDAQHVIQLHHDALVIQIVITNMNVRMILIDNGSSANLLFSSTLKAMQLDDQKYEGSQFH